MTDWEGTIDTAITFNDPARWRRCFQPVLRAGREAAVYIQKGVYQTISNDRLLSSIVRYTQTRVHQLVRFRTTFLGAPAITQP